MSRKQIQAISEEILDQDIFEELICGPILSVLEDMELESGSDNISISKGSFMVLEASEVNNNVYHVDIYDNESNIIEESATISNEDIEELLDIEILEEVTEDMLEIIEDIEEAYISFKGGKMRRFKLKPKKGYKRVKGRYVKIPASELAKKKRTARKMAMKSKSKRSRIKLARRRTMRLRKSRVGR